MNTPRQQPGKFSFPAPIPNSDHFEFGCVTTPNSPDSPADHLFLNGRLRPHVFTVQRPTSYHSSLSRSASSRGSLVSSRSNSTNSRSSNCSSARTSTSTEGSSSSKRPRGRRENSNGTVSGNSSGSNKVHGLGSRRWQLIAAAPVLKHHGRSGSKAESVDRKMSRAIEEEEAKAPWFGKRVLRSFVSACKECHAIAT